MNWKTMTSVYFIGVGGIGMSAIARFFNENGVLVSGYDKTKSTLTEQLESEGIEIHYDENVSRLPQDVDLVVYTPAIPKAHSELIYYKQTNIPVLKRAEVLGNIVSQGSCYAVAGSHGKSTTSAMLAHVFKEGSLDCTAFLGAIASNYQSNYIAGETDCFVVEADEYDRSFHHIHAKASIVTSIDSDHLDIYGDLAGVQQSFQEYVENMKPDSTLLIHNEYAASIKPSHQTKIFTYSLEEQSDYTATNIQQVEGGYQFDVVAPNATIQEVYLPMGGRYNIENALAVCAMAMNEGLNHQAIQEAFATFKGLHRRFERVLDNEQITLIDDYAHHPHEIRSFIEGVRELFPQKTIAAVFQPHLYSRTRDYADHFAQSLDLVDKVIIMPIYPAREEAIPGVDSSSISSKMKNNQVELVSNEEVVSKAVELETDVLLTIGAGDIAKQVPKLKKELVSKLSKQKNKMG